VKIATFAKPETVMRNLRVKKMKIKEYFDYWDEFFKIWLNSKTQSDYKAGFEKLKEEFKKSPFAYPKEIMNCDCKSNETFEYIPEPYWGWTPNLKTDLKFVVVNYNPASGGEQQHRSSKNISSITVYSNYVFQQINGYLNYKQNSNLPKPTQYETTNWHFNNRANKLAQLNSKLFPTDHTTIKNYLGIDLVPWHTKNVKFLNGYLEENFLAIQLWSLNFAIHASKQAKGLFANKVIVRTNLATFKELFKDEFESGFFIEDIKLPIIKKKNNDNFQKIKMKNEKDVEIYLLWGMRNSLPTESFLKEIFKPK
jgi:hypothetical protein